MVLNGPGGFSGEEATKLGRRAGVEGAGERPLAFFRGAMVVLEREKGVERERDCVGY